MERLFLIFFFLIVVCIIHFASKSDKKVGFWLKKIKRQPFNYYLLFILVLVGFFFRLDYTERMGCIVSWEPILDMKNILFSGISLLLVGASFVSHSRILKLVFIIIELIYWLSKLFLVKGGYLVGMMAYPDTFVFFYDSTVLFLRLVIVVSLVGSGIKPVYLLVCTLIVMSVKVFAYPLPYAVHLRMEQAEADAMVTEEFFSSACADLQSVCYMQKERRRKGTSCKLAPAEVAVIIRVDTQVNPYISPTGGGVSLASTFKWRIIKFHALKGMAI